MVILPNCLYWLNKLDFPPVTCVAKLTKECCVCHKNLTFAKCAVSQEATFRCDILYTCCGLHICVLVLCKQCIFYEIITPCGVWQ